MNLRDKRCVHSGFHRMLRKIVHQIARLWYKLVTLRSSPKKIAAGLAIGVFISFTPTFGFQTVLAIGCAALFKVNPVSTVMGVYLTNPFTFVPVYALCYSVGRRILGMEPLHSPAIVFKSLPALLTHGPQILVGVLIGGVVLGLLAGPLAYFLALFAVVRYRVARLNRRIEKMRRRIAGRAQDAPGAAASTEPRDPS